MRTVKRVALLVMAMLVCLTQVAFAANGNFSVYTDGESSKGTYRNNARGEFLAEGAVEITNRQDGNIYVNIYTMAYRNVDRIFHTVSLDQLNENTGAWIPMGSWDFEMTKEEEPSGLSMLSTSFTLTGYEVNKTYRLRGLHGVEYNDEIEGCATETDGVLITNSPY